MDLRRDFGFLGYILIIYSFLPAARADGPQWVEVRSPRFSVVTDGGEKRGLEVAMRFEQMRAVFGTLMTKVDVNIPVPLQIVAFRNTKEFRQIAPLWHGKPTELAGLCGVGGRFGNPLSGLSTVSTTQPRANALGVFLKRTPRLADKLHLSPIPVYGFASSCS